MYTKSRTEMYDLREEKKIKLSPGQEVYVKVRFVFEWVASILAVIVLSPLFLAVCVLQKISAPNEPIFFLQERIGRGDKPFKIIKFRSMKSTAPKYTASGELEHPEEYVSKLGDFLRKTSIDELPQLFNVISCKMGLIGPRPLIEEESEVQFLRWYYGIYAIRPGITGWAQVNGRDFVDTYDKVYYDREYVQNIGPIMDLKIFLKSIMVVLGRVGNKDGTIDESERVSVALENESEVVNSTRDNGDSKQENHHAYNDAD